VTLAATALPIIALAVRSISDRPAAGAADEGSNIYSAERDGAVFRLHILANSDSTEDQRVKLAQYAQRAILSRRIDRFPVLFFRKTEFADGKLRIVFPFSEPDCGVLAQPFRIKGRRGTGFRVKPQMKQ